MGHGQSAGGTPHFEKAKVKEIFILVQTLWSEDELSALVERLKAQTLNCSVDKVKFAKLLQLPSSQEALVEEWFVEFSHDKATEIVDGLEFLSVAILLNTQVELVRKTVLLFSLFDLDRSNSIRKDAFTIFLKAVSTGLHRCVESAPPPAAVPELSSLSADYFSSLGKQALSQQDLLTWVTEAHASLNYLSVLSRLQNAVFAWGSNSRCQLGLYLQPEVQVVPAPVLSLEGLRIVSVASSEFHCLFLTAEGAVWSCGSGFCGLLGHGDLQDRPRPQRIESLEHTRIVDVAAGVRHSVAVSEKGQVFTWGNADFGQLGHGRPDDREVHQVAQDARTGGSFSYVVFPTVVMGLFGQRVQAKSASCCSFSTAVLTKQGQIFTWGNNTDGQCGQGQLCPDHTLAFLDPQMESTAMLVLQVPRRLEVGGTTFKSLHCGGHHTLAVDSEDCLWTWGQGLWGKLGHGDQANSYEPRIVENLRYQMCKGAAAGAAHSMCLVSLYKLTVTGKAQFSLVALPLGRADRQAAARPTTPPGTKLRLEAFASARLLEIVFPVGANLLSHTVDTEKYAAKDIQESIVVFERGHGPGTYLKLENSNVDFVVKMSSDGRPIAPEGAISGPLAFLAQSTAVPVDSSNKVCIVDAPPGPEEQTPEAVEAWQQAYMALAVEMARQMSVNQALACIFVLPAGVPPFLLQAPNSDAALALKAIPFGVMSYEHGVELRRHVTSDVASATLLGIRQDSVMVQLQAVLALKPKGVVICQRSYRPDVELLQMPQAMIEQLEVPVASLSFQAGLQLQEAARSGAPWLSMEVNPGGGVCAWGDSANGQLGLGGLANQDPLLRGKMSLTKGEHAYIDRPRYVANAHELEVSNIACGASHTVALGSQSQVFSWGSSISLGVPMGGRDYSDEPVLVEQLEGTVDSKKVFAGHQHSFVLAEMPYPSVL